MSVNDFFPRKGKTVVDLDTGEIRQTKQSNGMYRDLTNGLMSIILEQQKTINHLLEKLNDNKHRL